MCIDCEVWYPLYSMAVSEISRTGTFEGELKPEVSSLLLRPDGSPSWSVSSQTPPALNKYSMCLKGNTVIERMALMCGYLHTHIVATYGFNQIQHGVIVKSHWDNASRGAREQRVVFWGVLIHSDKSYAWLIKGSETRGMNAKSWSAVGDNAHCFSQHRPYLSLC